MPPPPKFPKIRLSALSCSYSLRTADRLAPLTTSVSHGRQPPLTLECRLSETAASRWLHALVGPCHWVLSVTANAIILSPTEMEQ
jgi:hypothetical protein